MKNKLTYIFVILKGEYIFSQFSFLGELFLY